MARFTYSVITRQGQPESGRVEAPDRMSALRLLTAKPVLFVANVHEKDLPKGNKYSDAVQKWANEHLNPSIPWERELRAIIKNAISRAQNPTDFTYRRPQRKFVEDFVAAWTKVMNADRFDLK